MPSQQHILGLLIYSRLVTSL